MSSCVCKISFKSVQVCDGCCKMFRGLTFLGHSVLYSSQLSCLSYFGKLLFFTVENLSISARFSFITVIHCLPCRNTKSHEISLVVTFCWFSFSPLRLDHSSLFCLFCFYLYRRKCHPDMTLVQRNWEDLSVCNRTISLPWTNSFLCVNNIIPDFFWLLLAHIIIRPIYILLATVDSVAVLLHCFVSLLSLMA